MSETFFYGAIDGMLKHNQELAMKIANLEGEKAELTVRLQQAEQTISELKGEEGGEVNAADNAGESE